MTIKSDSSSSSSGSSDVNKGSEPNAPSADHLEVTPEELPKIG